ncbi:hypothetical protein BWQ93_00865 [Sphingopyxis sp. QXT-31]|uniref:hypothetical protein n=1 Tax=Sphingopyxis sp. QXT-31 TaxID=1357916 RepID=UPI00097944C3|nr:hypothetical protein [Sphingopyxis sp. QXT-31]APZ97203.1 hypothetical protein BWQ93_00865 [Sphingopyxis sp. QXT-31]
MFQILAATQAAATAAAPPAAAPAAAVAVPVTVPAQAMPAQVISPADVAAYIDPRDIAAYLPAPPPTTEFVAVSDSFFRLMENITMVALFVVGFFLVSRLIHAWMMHRSIRRALEAKSDAVAPLIEKLNKPYEHLGPWKASSSTANTASNEDRNGLVLLAIGLAMAGFGLIQGDGQTIREAGGAALFPAFVGIALLVRRRLARAAAAEDRAADLG